jgi:hypothetical protein
VKEFMASAVNVTPNQPQYLRALVDFIDVVFQTEHYKTQRRNEWLSDLHRNPHKIQGLYRDEVIQQQQSPNQTSTQEFHSFID